MVGHDLRVLVVDDEASIRESLERALRLEGFAVETAAGGLAALEAVARSPPAVIVLDVTMPDLDGVAVLRRLRAGGVDVPVCILSARDDVEDRVAGLQAGADDYLTKPFDFPELEARLHALMRRGRPSSAAQQLRGLTLDRAARRASIGGEPVDLSPREWTLLNLLLTERDRVVTKAQIAEAWGSDDGGSLEVYIHRLRKKLEGSGLAVRTVRGLGYLLEATASP